LLGNEEFGRRQRNFTTEDEPPINISAIPKK